MSSTNSINLVLFKSVSEKENDDDDVYSKTFVSAGFQVIVVPVLDFEYVNLEALSVKLKTPHEYAGIIYSSPRVVTGVRKSVPENFILENWRSHKHFVVGEKTAQMVEDLGLTTDGKETGNAKNLAKLISTDKYQKPFLYPKGSLTKDSFKSDLEENQISVDDIVIYKTLPHPDLEKNILSMKSQLSEDVHFVYFSPSGINFTLPILKAHQFDLTQVKFIAIGPSTELGLQENGLQVAATSSKPHPQALLEVVQQYNQKKV